MLFGEIAAALGAQHRARRIALRRALDRLAAQGQLGKRDSWRRYKGPRGRRIVWFRAD